ncbi:hypothetical protein D3C71_1695810 [compost metagenome]
MQHQRRRAHADFSGVLFQLRLHRLRRLRQHDGRGLVAGTGELALATGLHMHDVVGQHIDAQRGAGIGEQLPTAHAVLAVAGRHRAQIAYRLGMGRQSRQQQRGKQGQQQRRTTIVDMHLVP